MKKYPKIIIAVVILAGILMIAFYQGLVVRDYAIESELIEAPVRIVVISDLHSTLHGEGQTELLDLIVAQAPDLILLAGDIVDDRLPEEPGYLFLEKAVEIAPTYYVMGNHEFWSGFAGGIRQEASTLGVHVLRNEMTEVTIKGQKIAIYGMDDPEFVKYEHRDGDDWFVALENLWMENKSDHFKILISHPPELVDSYANFDFDLIVAGHSHGGQVRIPLLLNGLAAPGQGFFPKYAGGEYTIGEGTTMVVSRGVVVNQYPRVFNPPEVVVIDVIGE